MPIITTIEEKYQKTLKEFHSLLYRWKKCYD